jgi:polyphosphate kinase
MYHHRDLSWLAFNQRVLQEAADETVPLLERLKFLAIYSANLDEFFRVRVASLRQFRKLAKAERKAWLDLKPKKELRLIRKQVLQQQIEFGILFREKIVPALRQHQVTLLDDFKQFSATQKIFSRNYFEERLRGQLKIIDVFEGAPLPFLENRRLYLVLKFENDALKLLEIPGGREQRFVRFPAENENEQVIVLVDEILRDNLKELFPQQVCESYEIKVSRDAELYFDENLDEDLAQKIRHSLTLREKGTPTRFLYDAKMDQALLMRLKAIFKLKKNDLSPGGRFHNFDDFFAFPLSSQATQGLTYPVQQACKRATLLTSESLISKLQTAELFLHFPYHDYSTVIDLLAEAAQSPDVQGISITLYRVANPSKIGEALLQALENGKHVSVFVEAKARFDERSNLDLGEKLAQKGAQVYYSRPNLKVHAKVFLLKMAPSSGMQDIAYLGTGNFNEKTARQYTDHALITAKMDLTSEVSQVFDFLTHSNPELVFENLLVSPLNSRERFQDLLNQEIAHARSGAGGALMAKMNSLEDKGMIDHLYLASQAGVKIRLLVRGICCLVPGVAGLSENIEVHSIIDRYLEHGRVYCFANAGNEQVYLGSADWMNRNLDRRIEVVFPLKNPVFVKEIKHMLDLQWQDAHKTRLIDAHLSNQRPQGGRLSIPSQTAIQTYLCANHETVHS